MICIAGISLLVGGIGIMNIMLATVLERTREIGIRRAIGARQGDIVRQFLTEAVLISIVGGLIGIAFGFTLSRIIASAAGWSTVVTTSSIAVAFGVSVFIGLLFGIYPAVQAAQAGSHRGHSLRVKNSMRFANFTYSYSRLTAGAFAQVTSFPKPNYFRETFSEDADRRWSCSAPVKLQDFVVGGKLELSLKHYLELVMANNTDIGIQSSRWRRRRTRSLRAFAPFDPLATGAVQQHADQDAADATLWTGAPHAGAR